MRKLPDSPGEPALKIEILSKDSNGKGYAPQFLALEGKNKQSN